MFVDFQEAPDDHTFTADICIVGAGAAGITLAIELMRSGRSVVLVESGAHELDGATQSLHNVENTGISRRPPVTTRLRMFGGTTNHWTGKCGRLDPLDFAPREWIADSGWPLGRAELDPFYDRAHAFLDLAPSKSGPDLAGTFNVPVPELDADVASLYSWQLSAPTRFGLKFRAQLEGAANITVLLNANAVNIQANNAASHVTHVDLQSIGGKRGRVTAGQFVIGCGGIENARLLLLSDGVTPGGLGNRHDLVGRYFMEHLRNRQLVVLDSDPYAIQRIYNQYSSANGSYLLGLALSPHLQRREQISNAAFFTNFEGTEESASDGSERVARSLLHGVVPHDFSTAVARVARDFDEVATNFRRRLLRKGSRQFTNELSLMVIETEQAPNRDSRIELSTERDALGQRRARVHWRMTELDRRTVLTAIRSIASQLWLHHRARIHLPDSMDDGLDDWVFNFKDVSHHIGTTRMANDPSKGVVDGHCRVHGIDNLYLAGSSVFPTGGHVNPTMTIVALAIRLSDRLANLPREPAAA